MRIATALAISLIALPLTLAACGGHDDGDSEPFDTLQDCYDDHHNVENLTVQKAIVVCCLDHPIAGVHPSCLDSAAACVGHVRAALDASVTDNDISAACTTYIDEKNK